MKPIAEIPGPLQQYMNGLATHDLEKIGGSFADGVQFVTPVRTMGHEAILAFLEALYRGFPEKYLDENKHLLLAAGAMLDDAGTAAHGGVLLVDVESYEEAEAFVHNDPFWEAALFENVTITRWRKAFFNSERLVDL